MGVFSSLPCFFVEVEEVAQRGRVSTDDLAILKLKSQRDLLLIEKRNLLIQVEKDMESARSFLSQKDKNLALIALRKKKHHSQLVIECSKYILQMEELISSVEFAVVQQSVVEALEEGSAALRKIQKELSVDYVSELVGDAIEAKAHFEEINTLLMEAGVSADDPDVISQFEKLAADEAQEVISALPDIPLLTPPLVSQEASSEGVTSSRIAVSAA
ncbi:putative Charged multivesicular body protein 6-A [Cardiosporidium cionae]|uniref:Charged multivesicular body protein 6-A n=1 Tax=Cardiosporidium cionae TaxID=476202 RepID=A0ABQ7J753_9APIC|nr:putative Charged multivesicular body protein 6-A [Cardiosporidium cionae]|eukprot:KAF8819520.1 putative Charged multivesicular body protein 6-A [Cardiosporidium cionae]